MMTKLMRTPTTVPPSKASRRKSVTITPLGPPPRSWEITPRPRPINSVKTSLVWVLLSPSLTLISKRLSDSKVLLKNSGPTTRPRIKRGLTRVRALPPHSRSSSRTLRVSLAPIPTTSSRSRLLSRRWSRSASQTPCSLWLSSLLPSIQQHSLKLSQSWRASRLTPNLHWSMTPLTRTMPRPTTRLLSSN